MIIKYSHSVEKEYRENPAINQSFLKDLRGGVFSFKKIKEKREKELKEGVISESLVFGSYFDHLITGLDSERDELFLVADLETPPEGLLPIFEDILKLGGDSNLEEMKEKIINFESFKNYYGKQRKDEWKMNQLLKYEEYFNIKRSLGNRMLISEEQKKEAEILKENLFFHPEVVKLYETSENVMIYHQVPIYFSYEIELETNHTFGSVSTKLVDCKVLLDTLVVHLNEKGEAIGIIPIDHKTTAFNLLKVPSIFREFGYFIQGAFYTEALLSKNAIFPKDFPKLSEDCVVENFKFIFSSRAEPETPLIVTMDTDLISLGKNGSESIKGFDCLLRDYIFYVENGWEKERSLLEKNFNVIINQNFNLW